MNRHALLPMMALSFLSAINGHVDTPILRAEVAGRRAKASAPVGKAEILFDSRQQRRARERARAK